MKKKKKKRKKLELGLFCVFLDVAPLVCGFGAVFVRAMLNAGGRDGGW